MPDQIVEFEVRRQDFLTPGWVIVARWPNGREEPLIGLFTNEAFARDWIRDHGEIWISHRNADLE